jgi:hypothetical protein
MWSKKLIHDELNGLAILYSKNSLQGNGCDYNDKNVWGFMS